MALLAVPSWKYHVDGPGKVAVEEGIQSIELCCLKPFGCGKKGGGCGSKRTWQY
jgi:hypothetical protein